MSREQSLLPQQDDPEPQLVDGGAGAGAGAGVGAHDLVGEDEDEDGHEDVGAGVAGAANLLDGLVLPCQVDKDQAQP